VTDKFVRFSRNRESADPHFRFPKGLLPAEPANPDAALVVACFGPMGGTAMPNVVTGTSTVLPLGWLR
jgi:hypothetical protein